MHTIELKKIATPTEIAPEGKYVLVLYGPTVMDREHPRGRTLMVRDGIRNQAKLKEFAAALKTAKALAEAYRFPTVYVMETPTTDDAR